MTPVAHLRTLQAGWFDGTLGAPIPEAALGTADRLARRAPGAVIVPSADLDGSLIVEGVLGLILWISREGEVEVILPGEVEFTPTTLESLFP